MLVVLAAAACGTRTLPYRFASPMLGQADVPSAADSATRPTAPSAPSTERPTSGRSDTGRPHAAYGWQADAQAGVRTVSAHGIEITMPTASADAAAAVTRDPYARPAAWSSLRAPHKDSDVTVTTVHEPADLRALVGQRDKRDPYTIVIDWLGELAIHFDRGTSSDGPSLVAWADGAGKLHDPGDAVSPGDLLVFDRAVHDTSSDLVALVIARDARGVTEFLYAGGGVIRRGFLDPTRPTIRRDLNGAVVNTFLRHGTHWPPKGTRYLAGELLAHSVKTK